MKIAEIPVHKYPLSIIEQTSKHCYIIADNEIEYTMENEKIDIEKIDSSRLLKSGWNLPNDVRFASSHDFYRNIRINTMFSQLQTIDLLLSFTQLSFLTEKDYYTMNINGLTCILYKNSKDCYYKFSTMKEIELNTFLSS